MRLAGKGQTPFGVDTNKTSPGIRAALVRKLGVFNRLIRRKNKRFQNQKFNLFEIPQLEFCGRK